MFQMDRRRPWRANVVGGDGSRIPRGAKRRAHWCSLVVAIVLVSATMGQELIGTDICGCQPATYTFTFDFTNACPDSNVQGPGINATACLAEVRGEQEVPDEDLIPVTVSTVQIFELDQNLQVFSQTVRTGEFVSGSNFTYTSIISTISDLGNVASLPRGLQLVITGLNSKEQSTVQTYIITYTNDCGVFPILTEGQISGWTIFSDLGDPPTNLCPLAPSIAPTVGPLTLAPTIFAETAAPSTSPTTLAPVTVAPVTSEPSPAPIAAGSPTRSPVVETESPTAAPVTRSPVTDSPVVRETEAPVCPTFDEDEDEGKGKGKGKGMGGGMMGGKGKGKGGSKGGKGKGGSKGGKGKGGKGKGNYDGIRKKERDYGQMDRLDEERRRYLATGQTRDECPEPESGKGKGKGMSGGGSSDGKSGRSMGRYDDDDSGKGKGKGTSLQKKSRTESGNMEISRSYDEKSGKGGRHR